MRLFVSVGVPGAEVPELGMGRGPEGSHLTLKFLGEVAEVLVGEVGRELERGLAGAASFPFTLQGLGVFPSLARPRVLWVGVGQGRAEVEDLARRTEASLAPLGFPTEPRAFAAHVTLRRFRDRAPAVDLRALLERHRTTVFAKGWVRQVELQRSELGREGATHTPLLHVPLLPPLA